MYKFFDSGLNGYENELVEMLKEVTDKEWEHLFTYGIKDHRVPDNYVNCAMLSAEKFDTLVVGDFYYSDPKIRCIAFRKTYLVPQFIREFSPKKEDCITRVILTQLLSAYKKELKDNKIDFKVWVDFLVNKFGNRYIKLALEYIKKELENSYSSTSQSIENLKREQTETQHRQEELVGYIDGAKKRLKRINNELNEISAELKEVLNTGTGV